MKLNITKPPKVNVSGNGNSFWKQLGMLVLGTTISLVFTIVAAKLVENNQRAKDRRLSAMMVMSNIEQFARLMDYYAESMASADSISTWLLSKPIEELELLPKEELTDLIYQAAPSFWLTYDKSTERIFSNNIDTWKNLGNVQFIDNVGKCFSCMNSAEEYWNNYSNELLKAQDYILEHPDEFEGSSYRMKMLRNAKIRQHMKNAHTDMLWFAYTAAYIRHLNSKNMSAIGISKQEVMDYTDKRSIDPYISEDIPNKNDYNTPRINPANLTSSSFKALDAHLDSLVQHK